jgi:hypothetical protein
MKMVVELVNFAYFVFLAELLLFDKNRPLFQQFSKITSGLERIFSSLQAATGL